MKESILFIFSIVILILYFPDVRDVSIPTIAEKVKDRLLLMATVLLLGVLFYMILCMVWMYCFFTSFGG